MRKHYDINQLKLKRKGMLPTIEAGIVSHKKKRITISLDEDIINYFKQQAKQPGAFPYQTQINQALRLTLVHDESAIDDDFEQIKDQLLHDAAFIKKLAKYIEQRH